ncbi:MAG: cytochrome c maturation protein CcmE [Acidimicrobiales bacterium]
MPDTEDTFDLTPVAAPPTKRRGRWRTIGVLSVLALAVLALLSQGLLHSLNYFETIDQAMSSRAKLGTETFRLEGVVKPHTIDRTSRGASFWMTGGDKKVFVDAHGSPPQLFQSDIPVVVDGHFTSETSDTFVATQIIVKHTASYIAAHPKRVKAPNGTVR